MVPLAAFFFRSRHVPSAVERLFAPLTLLISGSPLITEVTSPPRARKVEETSLAIAEDGGDSVGVAG